MHSCHDHESRLQTFHMFTYSWQMIPWFCICFAIYDSRVWYCLYPIGLSFLATLVWIFKSKIGLFFQKKHKTSNAIYFVLTKCVTMLHSIRSCCLPAVMENLLNSLVCWLLNLWSLLIKSVGSQEQHHSDVWTVWVLAVTISAFKRTNFVKKLKKRFRDECNLM